MLQTMAQSSWAAKAIKRLCKTIHAEGYQIKEHVPYDGNCFFRSLVKLGIGETMGSLRRGLACLLYQFGDYKGIFPNQPDTSLKELFSVFNEVHWVYDEDEQCVTRYNYDTMCADVYSAGAWDRLPMQQLMLFISRIYDLEIVIYNSRSKLSRRIVWDESEDRQYNNRVVLGQLSETHYLPLEEIPQVSLSDSDSSSDNYSYSPASSSVKSKRSSKRILEL
jgi:hypothetical protein